MRFRRTPICVLLPVVIVVGGKTMRSLARCASLRLIVQTELLISFLAAFALVSGFTQQTPATESTGTPQSFLLTDSTALSVAGGKAEAAEYLGPRQSDLPACPRT